MWTTTRASRPRPTTSAPCTATSTCSSTTPASSRRRPPRAPPPRSISEQQNPESPYYGLVVPAYQASKAALNSVTIALAKSLSPQVKVTSVCPGWVQTDLGGPDNRAAAPLTADDAARVVVAAACLPADEPSGRFIDVAGTVPW